MVCRFCGGASLRPRRTVVGQEAQNVSAMPLPRAAWLVTVAVAVITALVVLVNGYTGYGVLSLVVAAAAAINVR